MKEDLKSRINSVGNILSGYKTETKLGEKPSKEDSDFYIVYNVIKNLRRIDSLPKQMEKDVLNLVELLEEKVISHKYENIHMIDLYSTIVRSLSNKDIVDVLNVDDSLQKVIENQTEQSL